MLHMTEDLLILIKDQDRNQNGGTDKGLMILIQNTKKDIKRANIGEKIKVKKPNIMKNLFILKRYQTAQTCQVIKCIKVIYWMLFTMTHKIMQIIYHYWKKGTMRALMS